MVKHRSTAIDCPVILGSTCFQRVSETTISALRRRILELDIVLGDEIYSAPSQGSGLDRNNELGLWYVVEGGLRVVGCPPNQGYEVSIALLHPGTIFGSLSALIAIEGEEDWIALDKNEPNSLASCAYRVIASTDSKIEYLSADLEIGRAHV